MAANLIKAGHEVAVWNRSAGKTVEGARAAATPAEAARDAEVVWICVSDTKAVESVLFGPQGVEATIASGAIIVDSSTISPSAERKFAEKFAAKGVHYVDAPVTGSKVAAEAGTLIFMTGIGITTDTTIIITAGTAGCPRMTNNGSTATTRDG